MLVIRFIRVGRRNQGTFRLAVAPKTSGLHANPVELLGSWNPKTKALTLKKERILHWLSQGAQPSASVHNLLVTHGLIPGPKTPVHSQQEKGSEGGAPEEASLPPTLTAEVPQGDNS